MATERLIPGEYPHPVVDAMDRKTIDIIVPVHKSVRLTTRCLDSPAEHIHEIAARDPPFIVINDWPRDSETRNPLL